MKFHKYHGLGNDFAIVDLRAADGGTIQQPDVVRDVCRRRFGVGADGVLAILPPREETSYATMRVLNADGSEAEMCGNGIRCVAKFLRETDDTSLDTLVIDTGAGPLECVLSIEKDIVTSVRVNMGPARLARGEIPMSGPAQERCVSQPLQGIDGLTFTAVSMGNPHAIAFVGADDNVHLMAQTIGPSVETHESFPQRTNAEFAKVTSPTTIELVVWERGSGMTLACGTGACATAAAACLNGLCEVETNVEVSLPGGPLSIRVARDYSAVWMTGPATHVFTGELAL